MAQTALTLVLTLTTLVLTSPPVPPTPGVHLNADNLQELERVRACLQDMAASGGGGGGGGGASVIGLRINPLVGAGAVGLLSVSTRSSKFGVVLPQERGAELVRVRVRVGDRVA